MKALIGYLLGLLFSGIGIKQSLKDGNRFLLGTGIVIAFVDILLILIMIFGD